MFMKFLLLLTFTGLLEAVAYNLQCPTLTLKNGRVRGRGKRVTKFSCLPDFKLIGNRYASCIRGQWDEPLPVCVRPGCPIPVVENAVPHILDEKAHVMYFCLPGFKFSGSRHLYCDGVEWDAKPPSCIDEKEPANLTCDFEDPNICGWVQDEYHDFDWIRYNKKTPSWFLKTGPTFDHTLGSGKGGHFMYLESTSRLQNDTARLLSPMYDAKLSINGCFSFWYHMYGSSVGGLRIYQRPEMLPLLVMTSMSESMKKNYLLADIWGPQGNYWIRGIHSLFNISDAFQIVIEGIRGHSFTGDIGIDDVAILQGSDCRPPVVATTPENVDSCRGRCKAAGDYDDDEFEACECAFRCFDQDRRCCPDFIEVCVFNDSSAYNDMLPQTMKLSRTTLPTVPKLSTPAVPTTHTLIYSDRFTIANTTVRTTTESTTKPTTPTTTKRTTKPPLPKITLLISTAKATTKIVPISTRRTRVFVNATVAFATRPTTSTVTAPVKSKTTTTQTTVKGSQDDSRMKSIKEKAIEAKKASLITNKSLKANKAAGSSSGAVTGVVITLLLLSIAGFTVFMMFRRPSTRLAWDRFRGRVRDHPEMRYLAPDDD